MTVLNTILNILSYDMKVVAANMAFPERRALTYDERSEKLSSFLSTFEVCENWHGKRYFVPKKGNAAYGKVKSFFYNELVAFTALVNQPFEKCINHDSWYMKSSLQAALFTLNNKPIERSAIAWLFSPDNNCLEKDLARLLRREN